ACCPTRWRRGGIRSGAPCTMSTSARFAISPCSAAERGRRSIVEVQRMKRVVATLVLLLTCLPGGAPLRAQAARPKLVVFIVVDQMRADYPVRYGGLLQHGLKRL